MSQLKHGVSLFEGLRAPAKAIDRKTKIVCTIGPSCVDQLGEMIDSGMNVARLNFSHGDHETHAASLAKLREAMCTRPKQPVGVMLDTKGPEIRTGFLENGGKVELKKGDPLKLITDYSFKGNSQCIACSYEKLPRSCSLGTKILIADGAVSLEVTETGDDYVIGTILNNAMLGERKNMNLPGVSVDLPVLSEKDIHDIKEFAIPQGCNFVAASFVQNRHDVETIREVLGKRGRHIKIISKIENEEGLRNFDEIVQASDAIMIARGDLGMEIPPEKVFIAQKIMIDRCNVMGKPVITATQMLESMVASPLPTRAEASDVANAVLDGSDCVMLSGETAGGQFPIQAVTTMEKIILSAEKVFDHKFSKDLRAKVLEQSLDTCTAETVCSAAVQAAFEVDAALMLVLTDTGSTARLVAKYRPMQKILAVSASSATVAHLSLVRGVMTLETQSFQGTDSILKTAMAYARDLGLLELGDKVVAVHGMREDVAGHSNLMKIITNDIE